jgi:hypothetical protein
MEVGGHNAEKIGTFTRNKYFSPLAPKFKFKPRVSYYAKYLTPHELKSCNVSPVSIKNYKELQSLSPSKPQKSCLCIKPIPNLEHMGANTCTSPKLTILPILQRPNDLSPASKIQTKINHQSPKFNEYIKHNNTYCISEFSTFDSKDLKYQIKTYRYENIQPKPPKSLKKVKEFIRTHKYIETGDNTDEYSLIGWEMNPSNELNNQESGLILH